MTAVLDLPTPADMLSQAPQPQLRGLTAYESDDEVVLLGRVSSYYLKQLAQEAVKSAVAGRRLVNRVEVDRLD